MSKVSHIIVREYTTRIRKKAFIIMTILGPVLFAALMIIPIWLTQVEDTDEKKIVVVEYDRFGHPVPDSLLVFKGVIKDKPLLKFEYQKLSEEQVETLAAESQYYGFLKIKHSVVFSGQNVSVEMLAKKQPSIGTESHITRSLESFLHDQKLLTYNVPMDVVKSLKTNVRLSTKKLEKDGFKDQGDVDVKRGVGYASSLLIYMFIFFFGSQVMRGVVEEKTNRIIEVIITSVKPFQLMLGKIIGVGLVGLTQFLAWIILTLGIFQVAQAYFTNEQLSKIQPAQAPTELFEGQEQPSATVQPTEADIDFTQVTDKILQINVPKVLAMFLFYFLGGYLLYGAMFAAIGSAVDNETDTQQFMIPVTIPLILSIILMGNAITNPSGQVAFWCSMIPLTSPVIMMARAPFDVPPGQIMASMAILVASFILFTSYQHAQQLHV